MTFRDAQKYLNSFVNYENIGYCSYQGFKLSRIKSFLQLLHNPQEGIRFLHIAGTKGKGSTCAFLANILKESGFKTGLYTSPHLNDFRERIRILSVKSKGDFAGMISPKDIIRYTARLKSATERFKEISRQGELTFFEVHTALAILYFKEKKVDFAVMETGLGGRLDATSSVNSLVAGITPISYEHTQILGDTLSKIAAEKAGTIKNKKEIVICAPQSKAAKKVIAARCRKFKARLFSVGKEISFRKTDGKTFMVKSIFEEYPNLKTRLSGSHQMINAATAIGMAEALRFHNIYIPRKAVRRGIAQTRWPGRFEIIQKNPTVILDGAQNVASCQALKETLKENFGNKKVILVLGISQDKDLKGICKELEPIAREIILTQSNHSRATKAELLKNFFKAKEKVYLTNNVRTAFKLAIQKAGRANLILVTGSLFVVGEARKLCLN